MKKYYLVHVEGLIDPHIEGQYSSEDARAKAAFYLHEYSPDYNTEDDVIFWLDVDVDGLLQGAEGVAIGAYSAGFFNNPIRCKLCDAPVDVFSAHLHRGHYIGACCWDERLRTTE
jgi:hypothetical protein